MASKRTPEEDARLSLHRAFALLQERYVLFILDSLLRGPKGFNELAREAACVSATTLATRLAKLEEEGLISKQVLSTMPPRTQYQLTARGHGLAPTVQAIEAWALAPPSADRATRRARSARKRE